MSIALLPFCINVAANRPLTALPETPHVAAYDATPVKQATPRDGFDKGNGAALINHSRRRPNCFLLRHKGRVWIVSGIDGIKSGEELTYDHGSDYYPRKGSRKK